VILFAPPTLLRLRTALDPDTCAKLLADAIDADRYSFLSFSGRRGTKEFVGTVDGREFRIFQRGYRNMQATLTGSLRPCGTGTCLEGSFDLDITTKIAICLFAVVGLAAITPIVLSSFREHTVPSWSVAIFVAVFLAATVLAPRIARWNGLDQERSIADFVRETLNAYSEDATVDWK
jgi:hypothetical protein